MAKPIKFVLLLPEFIRIDKKGKIHSTQRENADYRRVRDNEYAPWSSGLETVYRAYKKYGDFRTEIIRLAVNVEFVIDETDQKERNEVRRAFGGVPTV